MATLGPGALADLEVHALWNLTEMKLIQLADGTTFDQAISEIQEAANVLSGTLTSLPHYSGLFAVQDEVEVEYEIGVTNGVQESTEFSPPDALRGKTTGHNLPIKGWDRAMGWSIRGLRDRRRQLMIADTRSAINDMRNHFQQRMMQRFFKLEAESVGSLSGASVPLVDAGVADATYRPPDSSDGKVFTTSHTHFLRHAAINAANIDLVAEHLREHGHMAPWEMMISEGDLATFSALAAWNKPNWAELIYRATVDRAALPNTQDYVGFYESQHGLFHVWTSPRIPTAYYGAWKDYGRLDPRNPVRMRINPRVGFGWQMVPGIYITAPELLAVMHAEYDFGIGDIRTNGVAVEIDASGSYATPTIS